MKRCNFVIFIIFSVLLSSCNSITDTTTQAPVTTEAPIVTTTTITEEMTLTTETEITEETIETTIRTQEDINAAWEARLDYETGEVPNIESVQCEGGYKNYITNESYSDLNDLLISIVGEETNVPLYPSRCDGRILCGWNYCISVTECKVLSFGDVITDYDLYEEAVTEYITEHYDDFVTWMTEETYSLDQLINVALSDTNHRFELTHDSLKLKYDLNPDESVEDTFAFSLPYREYADLIKPQYLPGDGPSIYSYYTRDVFFVVPTDITDLDLPDVESDRGMMLENYNNHDYYWVYVTYARTGGDIDTPADYYQRYDYEMIFDITDENISYVYARDITGEEIPEPSYSIDDFIEKLNSVGL